MEKMKSTAKANWSIIQLPFPITVFLRLKPKQKMVFFLDLDRLPNGTSRRSVLIPNRAGFPARFVRWWWSWHTISSVNNWILRTGRCRTRYMTSNIIIMLIRISMMRLFDRTGQCCGRRRILIYDRLDRFFFIFQYLPVFGVRECNHA